MYKMKVMDIRRISPYLSQVYRLPQEISSKQEFKNQLHALKEALLQEAPNQDLLTLKMRLEDALEKLSDPTLSYTFAQLGSQALPEYLDSRSSESKESCLSLCEKIEQIL